MKNVPGLDPIPAEVKGEWEKFLAKERQDGLPIYPEVFANGWLFPLQRMREAERMIEMARTTRPRVVMEIGSDKGGGFYHWIKCLPTVEKAIAIEIRGVPFAGVFKRAFPERQLLCLDESSYEPATVEQVREFLAGDPIDCLFVDGDKRAFDQDFEAYRPMMRSGGIVFFHDIQDTINPLDTFRALGRSYRTEEIIDTSEYEAIERRMAAGLQPADSYEQWFRVWKRGSCGVGVIHIP